MKCIHPDIDFALLPMQAADSNVCQIKMRVTCKSCGERLRFLGIDEGISQTRPSLSCDGYTVILPGVMGLADVEPERVRAH